MNIILFYLLCALLPCGVQLLLLRLTRERFRPLRLLPLLGAAYWCVRAWRTCGGSALFAGANALGALLCLLAAVFVLAGWGCAWGVDSLWPGGRGDGERN